MSITKGPSRLSRLKNSAEFQLVYKRGARSESRSFVVFVLANGFNNSRVGLTTPRKLGTAVVRNRLRRRVREVLRRDPAAVPVGVDIVVNPRRSACGLEYADLKKELLALLRG